MRGDFTRFTYDAAKHYTGVRQQQGRVSVEADTNELQDIFERLRTVTTADVVGRTGGPAAAAGFEVTAAGADLRIGAGRYYVDGILCEAEAAVPIADQPDLPAGSPYVLLADGTERATPGPGTYVVYLDVWNRLLTALDDDTIRERALGGPDTATRVKTVWQARLLRLADAGKAITCGSTLPTWDALTAVPTGTMAARAQVDDTAPKPCAVPAGAGYRRLENQLYRVQVHKGGSTGTATFLWSRDNGSVERRWETTTSPNVTLSSPSGDPSADLPSGGWIELTDDTHELNGDPGTLVRVVRPHGAVIEINPATATGSILTADFPRKRRARRWDSDGAQAIRVPAANGGWLALEDGVEVHFASGSRYRTGDYWTFPARTATTDVEWPTSGGAPVQVAPHGVRHAYAKLAIGSFDGATWTLSDCRNIFPPLTGLAELFYVSGDGQEALPAPGGALVALQQRLRVGVSRGSLPAASETVEFSVTDGTGQIDGAANVSVTTGADGTASVAWSLDSTTPSQQVTARLLDPAGQPIHLPVIFSANLSLASAVAYDPAACADLAGATTVQQAIDALCSTRCEGCTTVVVSPTGKWWEAVESLPAGEPAHICFTTGRFEIDHPLKIAGLGHVLMHGAGFGTQIVAASTESAALVADCASFSLRDIAVQSGRSVAGDNINGALTVQNTPVVGVERVGLVCGTGPRRSGACLVVRPDLDPSGTAVGALESVRVRDCRLTVGHLQVGILVVSSAESDIADNHIAVAQDGAGLRFQDILDDRVRRSLLTKQLVARAVVPTAIAQPPTGAVNTTLSAGRWLIRFASPVAAEEWHQLAAANPPEAGELANAAGMSRYATRLCELAIEQPNRLGGFDRQLGGLARVLGNRFTELTGGATGKDVLRDLLIPGDVQVVSAFRVPDRSNRLEIGGTEVHFDSVITTDTWRRVLAAAGSSHEAKPALRLKQAAKKLVTDSAFRDRFGSVAQWWASLEDRSVPAMAQGIVVGGTVAEVSRVMANTIEGTVEGVRVAVSHRTTGPGQPFDSVGSATVDGNVIGMAVPAEQLNCRAGIYIGNARSVSVCENAVRAPAKDDVVEGVRVYGHLGPRLVVRSNLVENCTIGYVVAPVPGPSLMLGLVAENVAVNASSTSSLGAGVTARDNVP